VAKKALGERSPGSSPLRKMRWPVSVCVRRRAKEGMGGTGTRRGRPSDGRPPALALVALEKQVATGRWSTWRTGRTPVEWGHRRIGRGWRAREIWAGEGDRGGGGTHRWRMIFRDTVAAK
jgi:hypothetical protein